MLVTVVPCLVLDWAVLDPTRAGLFGVFFVTAGSVLVPLFYDGRRLSGVMPIVRASWINETAGRKPRQKIRKDKRILLDHKPTSLNERSNVGASRG